MRSVCRQNLPVLALSATVNVDYTDLIMSSCCLSKSVKIISTCSDRKNIRLAVVNIKSKNIECLRWLINGLIDYGMESPKIIIYCRTVNTVGWLFEKLLNELKEHAYQNKDKKSDNFLIGMYHAQTSEKNKTKVLQSLTTSEGIVRVVVATSSLGCGVNTKDVLYVVHFGPSFDTIVNRLEELAEAMYSSHMQCCIRIIKETLKLVKT